MEGRSFSITLIIALPLDYDFSGGKEYCISIYGLGASKCLNFDNPEDRDAYFEQLVGLLNVVEI